MLLSESKKEVAMRAKYLVLTCIAALAAPVALAQNAAPPEKIFASSGDIDALIQKAMKDHKPGEPNTIEPILSLAPYRSQLEYRTALAPAALHEKDAEMMYVLQGTGVITEGGKLVAEKRTNAANMSGTSIEGGTAHNVSKGDVIIIPQNTPHQVNPTGGAPIVLMTFHVPRPAGNWP
jgi:mannose-6-phosphate isomerase-like protein (cupin superfamily)